MIYAAFDLYNFVDESNKIERIFRKPLESELQATADFISLPFIVIDSLKKFVSICEPKAVIRDQYNMNVKIGKYIPPFGGPDIPIQLQEIINSNDNAYKTHIQYEKLHPFTDCNGRSGRVLWAWKNKNIKDGFLMNFYFQCLNNS